METERTTVCVAGGGPAGVMLGLLLARAGIDVTVFEKHDDFFRDFRGDTVHPSTLDIIDALGLRAAFDEIVQTPLPKLDAVVNGIRIHVIDLSTLPPPNRAITLMPQWDLLDLLADAGRRCPSFRLVMGAEVVGVHEERGRVRGVQVRTATGERRVEAALVVAADGRDSTVRRALGLSPQEYGVASDVAWFRVARPRAPLPDTLLWGSALGLVVTIPRPDYLQCGLLIPKGSFAGIRAAGVEAFRRRVAAIVPRLGDVLAEVESLDAVKLLSVQIDRLRVWWRPGALCIGDSAHAMSPTFGVGINYAVQDAVAAARVLVPAIRSGDEGAVDRACAAVQRRRRVPTALMQLLQRGAHRLIASGRLGVLVDNPPTRVQRTVMRVVLPLLRPLFARVVGRGFLPEKL